MASSSIKIGFDASILTKPYRLKRCVYQLMHFATAAALYGFESRLIVNDDVIEQCDFLARSKSLWSDNRDGLDIYVAKSDAYYKTENYDKVTGKLVCFKVCLCNSDMCFRESSKPFRKHIGAPVIERCDLYMPVNHTLELLRGQQASKVIPVAHPIDPRFYELLFQNGLYEAYLFDDIDELRSAFSLPVKHALGFMGHDLPNSRKKAAKALPEWVHYDWSRTKPIEEYIEWMMSHQGCLDLPGHGDKSLRFTEAVLLGRTIVGVRTPSLYDPPLVYRFNCLLADAWSDYADLKYDAASWRQMAERATDCYINGWSISAQLHRIIACYGGYDGYANKNRTTMP